MLTKTEAKKKIEEYFSGNKLDPVETKKIQKLAMANRIRLGEYRKRFCRSCFSELRVGKTRVTKNYKTIICPNCSKLVRFRIS